MAIKSTCPNGCELRVPDRYIGRRVKCPKCRVSFEVSHLAALPPSTGVALIQSASPSRDLTGDLPVINVTTAGRRVSETKDATEQLGGATDLISRGEQSRLEKVFLCRLFSLLLTMVAIAGAIPAILGWWNWLVANGEVLPFWVLLSVAIAAWQLLFSILLSQVPDWSTLKAAAGSQLIVIFAFGLFATIFALSDPTGWFNQTLQMTTEQFSRGSMWCVAMLCLALIASLACYREGQRWKRMEDLIEQLVSDREAKG